MNPISRDRFVLGSYQYLRYSLPYFLDTAVELEIPHLELYSAAPQFYPEMMDLSQLYHMRREIRSRGLSVYAITPEQVQYPVNLAAEYEPLRQASIRTFRLAIDAANLLECPYVITCAGCGLYDRPTRRPWQLAADSLAQLGEYARKMGVVMLLETLTPLSSNLLNTPEQQREMLSLLPPDSTSLMVDIGQMVYMEQSLDRYLAHGKHLSHVHLHDSHPGIHIALGDGDLPISTYLEQIEGAGYTGKYALELNDPRYRSDPRAADRQSVAYLEQRGLMAQ